MAPFDCVAVPDAFLVLAQAVWEYGYQALSPPLEIATVQHGWSDRSDATVVRGELLVGRMKRPPVGIIIGDGTRHHVYRRDGKRHH